MKWGTDSGGSGAASGQAALVTVMISEAPHFVKSFVSKWQGEQHHFVSIISFRPVAVPIEVGRDFDERWGTTPTEVGHRFDASGAPDE